MRVESCPEIAIELDIHGVDYYEKSIGELGDSVEFRSENRRKMNLSRGKQNLNISWWINK